MIEGTPLLLDSGSGDHGVSSASTPSFKIPPTPRRDAIGHRLAEGASKSLRQRSQGKQSSSSTVGKTSDSNRLNLAGSSWSVPSPKTMREPSPLLRSQMLSPAAQKLLASKGFRSVIPGKGLGVDAQLRASYSASPGRVKTPQAGVSTVSQLSVSRSSTPITSNTRKSNSQACTSDSITDNLLNF
jgi:hypothetical protein